MSHCHKLMYSMCALLLQSGHDSYQGKFGRQPHFCQILFLTYLSRGREDLKDKHYDCK